MQHFISRIAFTILILAAAQGLRAKDRCDNKALDGSYGMFATGSVIAVPDPAFSALIGPFVRVGRVEADGKGHVSVSNTASYNGFIITESYSGNYSVNDQCGIEFHLLVPLPIPGTPVLIPVPFTFIGSLADGGSDASVVIISPPGASIRVHLRRQDNNKSKCSNKELDQGYQLDLFGTNVTQVPVGPFVREGTLEFDGKGHFTGSTIASNSGLVITGESLSGTYSVDASCDISIHFTLNSQSYTWLGTLTDNSEGAVLIQSVPAGTVVAGTLRQQ